MSESNDATTKRGAKQFEVICTDVCSQLRALSRKYSHCAYEGQNLVIFRRN